MKQILVAGLVSSFEQFFSVFFHSTTFYSETKGRSARKNIYLLLQLILPTFVLCSFITIPIRLSLLMISPDLFLMSGLYWRIFLNVISGIIFAYIFMLIVKIAIARIFIWGGIKTTIFGLSTEIMRGTVFIGVIMGIIFGLADNITTSFVIGSGILLGYYLNYYGMLQYFLISFWSSILLSYFSIKNPGKVFNYLNNSPLYHHEKIHFPLLGLKKSLAIAIRQDEYEAVNIIRFIESERAPQLWAARATILDLILLSLEKCHILKEFAKFHQYLDWLLPVNTQLPKEVDRILLQRLSDSSRETEKYCSILSQQSRRVALTKILEYLNRIYSSAAFKDKTLNNRLTQIIETWKQQVYLALAEIEHISLQVGELPNPYAPGVLPQADEAIYVGRKELIQQLLEAVSRGSRRPTFLLNGERRMGKTSTLVQLPTSLGTQYVSVWLDCLSPSISASADSFANYLIFKISTEMNRRGIPIKEPHYPAFKEAARDKEPKVYSLLNQWLTNAVEKILERENRVLLLLFDEFERFEDAEKAGYLNLPLLLMWFRSIIQGYPRIALLFSGLHSLAEIPEHWASHLINVRTLSVGLLQQAEIRELILRPRPDFPGYDIFGKVVEAITHTTGGHPFLTQAICCTIIENLNHDGQLQADQLDVLKAVDNVLNEWWNTYFRDLWGRTTASERVCLRILKNLGQTNKNILVEESGLHENDVQEAISLLERRQLVICENASEYRVVGSIFLKWIEKSQG